VRLRPGNQIKELRWLPKISLMEMKSGLCRRYQIINRLAVDAPAVA